MKVTRSLVRLYPGSFRNRWGADLEAEATAAGWRAWPNLALSAVDVWLHPVIWPADSRTQRRARAAAMAVLVTVAGWFLAHFTTDPGPLVYHTVLNGCAFVLLFGLGLVVPRPRLTFRALFLLSRRLLRHLAPPALLGLAVLAAVWTGWAATVPAVLRLAFFLCWWGAMALGLIQSCRIIAGLGSDVIVPPRPWRIRLGIVTLAVAAAAAAAITLDFSLTGANRQLFPAALAAGLLALTLICLNAVRDLRGQVQAS